MGVNVYQNTLKDTFYVNMEGETVILTYICKFCELDSFELFFEHFII